MAKAILMVGTSHDLLGDTGVKTGVWLEELAAAYLVFSQAGYEVLLATPDGANLPLDPMSLEEPWLLPAGSWFLAEKRSELSGVARLGSVRAEQVEAIYLIGGTGTLWDFPKCQELGALLTSLAADNKPIAAVCHGVVGLLNATDMQGNPLVQGRSVTGFSNAEEVMVQADKIVPLLAETALKQQGALYSCGEPFEPHVVGDGKLLTGQNPASAQGLARALLAALE